MKRRAHTEDDLQRAVFQWITLATPRIPGLAIAFHPANGGRRDAREAARLKGMGVRPGVPDIMIPYPQVDIASELVSAGLAIELKSANGVLTDSQKDWHQRLSDACWEVHVCRSFDEARGVIAAYFNTKP